MTKRRARGSTPAGAGASDLSALGQISATETEKSQALTVTLPTSQILSSPGACVKSLLGGCLYFKDQMRTMWRIFAFAIVFIFFSFIWGGTTAPKSLITAL